MCLGSSSICRSILCLLPKFLGIYLNPFIPLRVPLAATQPRSMMHPPPGWAVGQVLFHEILSFVLHTYCFFVHCSQTVLFFFFLTSAIRSPESARASWSFSTRSDVLCQQFSSSPRDLTLTCSLSVNRHFLILMWTEETGASTLCCVVTALSCFVGISHFRALGNSWEEAAAANCWDEMKEVLVFRKLWN